MTLDSSAIDFALQAQARGDLAPLQALLQAHAGNGDPRIEHLRGVFACATGHLADGSVLLRRASERLPGDGRIAGDLAKSLYAQQRLAEALDANRTARELDPAQAEHHLFHGYIALASGSVEQAMAAFAEAARLAPGDIAALKLHAQTAHHLRRYDAAESSYLRVLGMADDPACRTELATLYNASSRPSRALDTLSAVPSPTPADLLQRAIAHQALGDYAEAADVATAGLAAAPADAELQRMRGVALQHLTRHTEAAPLLLDAMRQRFAPAPHAPSRLPEHLRYSRAKLLHDIEQLQHLQANGLLPNAPALLSGYRQLLQSIPAGTPDTTILDIPGPLHGVAHAVYNRLHHLTDAPRLARDPLRERDDASDIQQAYLANPPGIAVIDGFLSDEALASLRRYCLESTIWFDFNHPNGYLGATFENGFAAPLLLQIVEGLRQRFPAILRDYPLTQLWAFKYDSHLDGIELHADIAAANLNFWITPDEANLDPDCGGLVVWDKEAPQSWRFDEFNTRGAQARITDFLGHEGAREVRIPYRCNRAVLFNSDLFHRTDAIRFKDGYSNRRINITMLFGYRDSGH